MQAKKKVLDYLVAQASAIWARFFLNMRAARHTCYVCFFAWPVLPITHSLWEANDYIFCNKQKRSLSTVMNVLVCAWYSWEMTREYANQ